MTSNLEKHLWNGQRYHSLNYHLQQIYGEKVYKLAIDGGFTCPNRDADVFFAVRVVPEILRLPGHFRLLNRLRRAKNF